MVSQAEKKFIIAGCTENLRYDGRGVTDYRSISIENCVLPHVNGSSRVKIASGFDIICSIKVEVGEPRSEFPDEGCLEFGVDISPSCKPSMDDRNLMNTGSDLADILQSIYLDSKAIDLKDYSIIVGKYCWIIQVDFLIMEMNGDPLDACSIACYVAMQSCQVPKITLYPGESGRMEDFEISGELSDAEGINIRNIPILVSVVKVGSTFLVDASGAELACGSGVVSTAMDRAGQCCGIKTAQSGVLTTDEFKMGVQVGMMAAASIFLQLDGFFSAVSENQSGLAVDAPPNRAGLFM